MLEKNRPQQISQQINTASTDTPKSVPTTMNTSKMALEQTQMNQQDATQDIQKAKVSHLINK